MTPSAIAAFAAVSFAVIIAPGPSVLFAISRAIVGGRRSGLLTVLGNAAGLFVQVIVVALGIGVLVTSSDEAYTPLKLTGAAYLVWLGISAIRHRHATADALRDVTAEPSTVAPLRDGFTVGVTNPKSLVFLAALLPQYVVRDAGAASLQMVLLGAIFCLVAIVCDGTWALSAARARGWLAASSHRLSLAAIAGGLTMIGLGLLLALSSPG